MEVHPAPLPFERRGWTTQPVLTVRFNYGRSWLTANFTIQRFNVLTYVSHMIALLDYGSGNLRSVEKALRKVGADVRLATRPAAMKDARAVVLPGVGAFDDRLNALHEL